MEGTAQQDKCRTSTGQAGAEDVSADVLRLVSVIGKGTAVGEGNHGEDGADGAGQFPEPIPRSGCQVGLCVIRTNPGIPARNICSRQRERLCASGNDGSWDCHDSRTGRVSVRLQGIRHCGMSACRGVIVSLFPLSVA